MHQDLQTLPRCHMLAFSAIGGVPIEILYDRMKTALIGEDADGHIIYNPVLEGRRQYRIDPAHRRGALTRTSRHMAADDVFIGRVGEHVAHRSLAFYQAIGERLALAGGRS